MSTMTQAALARLLLRTLNDGCNRMPMTAALRKISSDHFALLQEDLLAPVDSESGKQVQGDSIAQITAELENCHRCKLHQGRKTVVIGKGDVHADLMFIGEAPGRDEDMQGKPFVGQAGQLLDKIIQAMGFERDEVYIANIIKCRPPANRNPDGDEIATCSPFLKRQVQVVRPKLICTLGSFAAQTLLNTDTRISLLRGRFHEYMGIPLMPTYHPAFLLRNPAMKKPVWEDVQQVSRRLGKNIRGRQ